MPVRAGPARPGKAPAWRTDQGLEGAGRVAGGLRAGGGGGGERVVVQDAADGRHVQCGVVRVSGGGCGGGGVGLAGRDAGAAEAVGEGSGGDVGEEVVAAAEVRPRDEDLRDAGPPGGAPLRGAAGKRGYGVPRRGCRAGS